MARDLIKIKDKYFEWSTTSDAPTTFGMSLGELIEYIRKEYGNNGLRVLLEHLECVEERGTSFVGDKNLEDILSGNRAGENKTEITAEEIYQRYVK